eukprot:4498-Heterococcus_DN1.PRE.3
MGCIALLLYNQAQPDSEHVIFCSQPPHLGTHAPAASACACNKPLEQYSLSTSQTNTAVRVPVCAGTSHKLNTTIQQKARQTAEYLQKRCRVNMQQHCSAVVYCVVCTSGSQRLNMCRTIAAASGGDSSFSSSAWSCRCVAFAAGLQATKCLTRVCMDGVSVSVSSSGVMKVVFTARAVANSYWLQQAAVAMRALQLAAALVVQQ